MHDAKKPRRRVAGEGSPVLSRTRRTGEVVTILINADDTARFWSKVEQRSSGCWPWAGVRFANGYGSFSVLDEPFGAHRVMHALTNGPVPAGMWVLHHCDHPWCVRPAHLYLGDHEANEADKRSRMRHLRGERVPQSKLTHVLVAEIRRRWAQGGITQRALAQEYGVHKSMIGYVVRNVWWRTP